MRLRQPWRWLELSLANGLLLLLFALPPVTAGGPVNSGRHPSTFEVHAPMPRNRRGPTRIPVYRNREANQWVSTVFSRLASAANLPVMPQKTSAEERERMEHEEADIPDKSSTEHRNRGEKGSSITILEWDIVNAFATPGEKLYVTTGLLSFVDSDDELAGVIGHEIAHVRLNHIEKRMKRQMVSSLLFALATIRGGRDAFMAGQALSSIPVRPYGQGQELESDATGIDYVAAAGYDPNGVVTFLEKMHQKELEKEKDRITGIGSLLATHPPTADRVRRAQARLRQMGIPLRRPEHLSYNFKLDRLSLDLSSLNLGKVTEDELKKDKPRGSGKVYTTLEITGNLIQDGDFEGSGAKSGLPDGWRVVEGEAWIDDQERKQGRRSLRVTSGEGGGKAEVEGPMAPIDTNQDYLLSGYIRSGDPHERLSFGLRYYDDKKEPIETDFPAARQVFVPEEWTRYQGVIFSRGTTFSLPPAARFARVVLQGTFTSQTPSWFDALVLIQVGK